MYNIDTCPIVKYENMDFRVYHDQHYLTCHFLLQGCKMRFLTGSTTSVKPLKASWTTFSISLCAFFKSSGRTVRANSIALSLFCIMALAFLTFIWAASWNLVTARTAWSLDALVGGGIGTFSCCVLCGSGTGWRFSSRAPWIADVIGLTCCFPMLI